MHCGIQFLKSHGACIQTTVVCMKIPTHMMTLARNSVSFNINDSVISNSTEIADAF